MENTEKKTWGGKRREGKTKTSIQVTIDTDLLEYVDKLGEKRSAVINEIIKQHEQNNVSRS